MKDSKKVLKHKILNHALNNGFHLVGYSGCTIDGRSFLPDYNKDHKPPLSKVEDITNVLKEAELIVWKAEYGGFYIPLNIDERLEAVKEQM